MKRILFVDDEANVLKGLQRMLHGMRYEWEMQFAFSGWEALAALEARPFDVVVTDMRMPRMDGAELLAVVRERFPRVVRIVLSGHSDLKTVLRAIPSTHQFLNKPCDAAALKEAIARSCALHDLLASDALRETFYRLNTLPCLPEVYFRLVEQLNDPGVTLEQVGLTISQDIAMSAKILQLVNTPFFGICHHVASPAQAAMLLGIDTLRTLVLSAGLFSKVMDEGFDREAQHEFRLHSLMVGSFAREIVSQLTHDSTLIDHAFTGGVLHDLGRLVIASSMPQFDAESVHLARAERLPLWRIEKEWLGATHANIGACLLALQGLPDPIVDSVAYHHCPSSHPGGTLAPLTAVHIADALYYELRPDPSLIISTLDMPYLERLGVAERLPGWRDRCERMMRYAADDPARILSQPASSGQFAAQGSPA